MEQLSFVNCVALKVPPTRAELRRDRPRACAVQVKEIEDTSAVLGRTVIEDIRHSSLSEYLLLVFVSRSLEHFSLEPEAMG